VNQPTIISRVQWGALPWATPMHHIDVAARDYFFNHYHGGIPRHDRGVAMAKEIEAIHRAEGWAGPGYAFMVGQDGVAFEGRGWELVGAHCPGYNTRAVSVCYAVGLDQVVTAAAKSTGRWLRDEHARRRGGKIVTTTWHGAHYATACCGRPTQDWVKAGMPVATLAPVVVQVGRPAPPAQKPSLVKDGWLGAATWLALEQRLVAAGFSTVSPNRVSALQRYLNAKLGGPDLKVDGLGFRQDGVKYLTVAAVQRWVGQPVDGRLSSPSSTVVRIQDRLNRGNF